MPAMLEDTLIIFKPDSLERHIFGELMSRFERAGISIVELKLVRPDVAQIALHYQEHVEKDFYPALERLLSRGPSIVAVLRGYGAVMSCRKIRGNTDPALADPGTICGDFGHALVEAQNMVHASSSPDDAAREISIWFDRDVT